MQAMLTLVSSSTGQLGGHEGCRNLLPKSQPLLPSIFPQINLNFPPAAPHSSCPPPAIGPFGSFSLLRGQRLNRPNDPEPRAAGTAQNTQGRAGRRAPSTRGAQAPKAAPPFTPGDLAPAMLPSGRGPCSNATVCRSSAVWCWHASERAPRNAADPAHGRATGRRQRAERLGFPAERRYLLALPKPSRTDCFRIIQ